MTIVDYQNHLQITFAQFTCALIIWMKISFGNFRLIMKKLFYLLFVFIPTRRRCENSMEIKLIFMSDLSQRSRLNNVCEWKWKRSSKSSSCNSETYDKGKKIIMKTMKMTRGNYLSLDSHSIFHTMKHQHEELFSTWKIWAPRSPTRLLDDNNRKIIHRREEIMWCDKRWWRNIFSNTNNFHCVAVTFHRENFVVILRWIMSRKTLSITPSPSLSYQQRRLFERENKFHIKWHSKLLKIFVSCRSMRRSINWRREEAQWR